MRVEQRDDRIFLAIFLASVAAVALTGAWPLSVIVLGLGGCYAFTVRWFD